MKGNRIVLVLISVNQWRLVFLLSQDAEHSQIKTGADRRDVDSDDDEMRWRLGTTERVQSVRR